MAARVTIDGKSIAGFVASDSAMQEMLKRTAEELMAKAMADAPRGVSISRFAGPGKLRRRSGGPDVKVAHRGGYYLRHFAVRKFRNQYRLWNTDPFAHLVEWGSVHNPAYAPIRRAVRSSGLRYKEGRQEESSE